MNVEYYQDEDGIHFWKKTPESILHVMMSDKNITKERYEDRITYIYKHRKGDALINKVKELSPNAKYECSKELFEDKLKEAIFVLGIYETTHSK